MRGYMQHADSAKMVNTIDISQTSITNTGYVMLASAPDSNYGIRLNDYLSATLLLFG